MWMNWETWSVPALHCPCLEQQDELLILVLFHLHNDKGCWRGVLRMFVGCSWRRFFLSGQLILSDHVALWDRCMWRNEEEGVAHSVVKWNKLMNKRPNISYKVSQPGVVTCFHKVSISALGNRKHIPHLWGKIVMNWTTTLPPQHPFPICPWPQPKIVKFYVWKDECFCKIITNLNNDDFLIAVKMERGEGRAGIGMALQHWQGFSGWFSVDWFAVYSAAIVCNVLCQLMYPEP